MKPFPPRRRPRRWRAPAERGHARPPGLARCDLPRIPLHVHMPAVVAFETAPQLIRRLAAHYAGTGKAALGYKDRDADAWVDVTWDDLYDRATAFAGFLHARGVRHGDRVAILSENRVEWAVTDLAAQLLGAVTVALYPTLPADQAAFIVCDSGAKVLVASTGLQLRKADAALDACPDLVALVAMSPLKRARPDSPITAWADALAEGARQRAALDLDALADAVGPDDLSALIYTCLLYTSPSPRDS